MNRTTIVFERTGKSQNFTEWDVDENQIVVDSRPRGKAIWKGTKVLTLCIGCKPDIKTPYEERERQLNYTVIDLKVEDEHEKLKNGDVVHAGDELAVKYEPFSVSIRRLGHRL